MSADHEARAARTTVRTVRSIRLWTPVLWSLRITRPDGFTFAPGHYARLGLPAHDPLAVWRPYSIVSAPADPELEFLVVLIPEGSFSRLLAQIEPGQPVAVESAVFGFFLETQLTAGDTLWMMATGTGIGPYISLLRTPGALDRHARAVLVHSVRQAAELAYRDEIEAHVAASNGRLSYLPIVTREPGATPLHGRIPQLVADGALQKQVMAPLDPATDRVMVCGNPDFTADMRRLLGERGFVPCRRNTAGTMLFEKYW